MPKITKRRVTMSNPLPVFNEATDVWEVPQGGPVSDFVRPDFLDAYVADAKTRWKDVEVSEEPDAGPGGYHGATHVPEHLDHELAGQTFAATKES